MTLLARGEAPYSTKYSPIRSFFVQIKWRVSTPNSRALFWAILPKAFSGSRLTKPALRPSLAMPAATVSSDPPTVIFNVEACSNLSKSGGARRIIASPKVMTSGMPPSLSAVTRPNPGSSLPVDEDVQVPQGLVVRVRYAMDDAGADHHRHSRSQSENAIAHADGTQPFKHVVKLFLVIV